FTNEEYSRARSRMLDAMAANVVAKSGVHLGSQTLPRGQPAVIPIPPTITSWDYLSSCATSTSSSAFRSSATTGQRRQGRRLHAPARRLTARRISIFAAAAAASVILSFVILPIIWRPADQNQQSGTIVVAAAPLSFGTALTRENVTEISWTSGAVPE